MAQCYSVAVCIAGLVDEHQLRLSSGSLSVLSVYHLVPEGREEGEGIRGRGLGFALFSYSYF